MNSLTKENYLRVNQIKDILTYIGKLVSSAILILLVIVGMFLIYYVVAAQVVLRNPSYTPLFSLYNIVTGSMEPNIKVDDVILNTRVTNPEKIKVGDVITFTSTSSLSKNMTVTHRVIKVIKNPDGTYEYVTKGDYNPSADSSTAKFENIKGKVALKLPGLGKIQGFLATKMGWFIVVLLPALGVIIYDIIKVFKLCMNKKSVDTIKEVDNGINSEVNKQVDISRERLLNSDYKSTLNDLKNFGK